MRGGLSLTLNDTLNTELLKLGKEYRDEITAKDVLAIWDKEVFIEPPTPVSSQLIKLLLQAAEHETLREWLDKKYKKFDEGTNTPMTKLSCSSPACKSEKYNEDETTCWRCGKKLERVVMEVDPEESSEKFW